MPTPEGQGLRSIFNGQTKSFRILIIHPLREANKSDSDAPIQLDTIFKARCSGDLEQKYPHLEAVNFGPVGQNFSLTLLTWGYPKRLLLVDRDLASTPHAGTA